MPILLCSPHAYRIVFSLPAVSGQVLGNPYFYYDIANAGGINSPGISPEIKVRYENLLVGTV